VAGDRQCNVADENILEGGRVAGHQQFEVLVDLVLQGRALADQVASVPGQRTEPEAEVVGRPLGQAEAVDRGPVDGVQVGLVGPASSTCRDIELNSLGRRR
jgi:hypothetical protein